MTGTVMRAHTILASERVAVVPPASPSAAEAFVRRFLAMDDEDARRALLDAHGLCPTELHDALRLLDEEAVRLHGSDPRRMEQICAEARDLARASGDAFMEAMLGMHHGDALRAQGRNADSLDLYDAAARSFLALGYPVEAARSRIGWVWAAAGLGRYDDALSAARKARRVLVAHGERFRVAGLDLNTGNVYIMQGRHREALHWYSRALETYEGIRSEGAGDVAVNIAWCHANRGSALTQLGRHQQGLAELEIARATFLQVDAAVSAGRVMRSFGQNQMDLGRYAAALRAFQSALEGFRALALHEEALTVAATIADCYLLLNRPADALVVLGDAEEHLQRTDSEWETVGVVSRKVAALLALGHQEEALALLDAAERSRSFGTRQHQAWLLAQRAGVLLDDGRVAESLAAAQHARRIARANGMRRLTADASITEGLALLALDRPDEARRAGTSARRIANDIDAVPLRSRVHDLLGRVAEAHGSFRSARHHYATAIAHLEREQRGVIFEFRDSFAAGRGAAYERLAGLQLAAGRPSEALSTAERAKSRALADAIGGAVDLRPRGSAVARRVQRDLTLAREQYAAVLARRAREERDGAARPEGTDETERQPAELERRIASLVQQLQLLGEADAVADLYSASMTAPLPPLPAGTVLVEFFVNGDQVLRFVVDRAGVRGEALPCALPEIERLLRALRLNLDATQRSRPDDRVRLADQARAALQRLCERLLGDLDGLSAYDSLVIVPHGLLHYLPFHALHDGERYLVERFTISYAPSAAIYGICRARARRRARRGRALVLAHSAGGQLPFAVEEAGAVAGVLGVDARTGAAATRALLAGEGRQADLIHVAAHGIFRHDAPLFSHVELADGPLTTADVFNLSLRASLVTLSACETGRAVVGGGDELVGLARAFLYAGAAGLLVSQWRVEDASTAALMACMYQHLVDGATAAAALRAAQVALLDAEAGASGHQHPFFWAGFQIIGDGQALEPHPGGWEGRGSSDRSAGAGAHLLQPGGVRAGARATRS
jgi:CHAT domain-containing protein